MLTTAKSRARRRCAAASSPNATRRSSPRSIAVGARPTSRPRRRSRTAARARFPRASRFATLRPCRYRRWRGRRDRARSRGMRAPSGPDIVAGEVLLAVENVSLAFGGVKAISGVSFDIRKGEIRAIIGPNGAGKTSLLNVINGFYHPQQGRITFKGRPRSAMRPYEAALGGIARTFQNVALFKGMTALDNILAGRTLKMRRGFLWQLIRIGPALAE